jgi:hypothetical protein
MKWLACGWLVLVGASPLPFLALLVIEGMGAGDLLLGCPDLKLLGDFKFPMMFDQSLSSAAHSRLHVVSFSSSVAKGWLLHVSFRCHFFFNLELESQEGGPAASSWCSPSTLGQVVSSLTSELVTVL